MSIDGPQQFEAADAHAAPADSDPYPRNRFLARATLGLGGLVAAGAALPAAGFALLPSLLRQRRRPVDLGGARVAPLAPLDERGTIAADTARSENDNSLVLRLTHGMSPWALGQPWFEYDPKEAPLIPAFWLTAKAAAEGVRKYAPSLKVLFGHCAAKW